MICDCVRACLSLLQIQELVRRVDIVELETPHLFVGLIECRCRRTWSIELGPERWPPDPESVCAHVWSELRQGVKEAKRTRYFSVQLEIDDDLDLVA